MRAFAIQLYRDSSEEDYCGCYWIHVTEGVDDRRDDLAAAGCGLFRDEDGELGRSFFLADEIDDRVAEAERVTGAYAVAEIVTTTGAAA